MSRPEDLGLLMTLGGMSALQPPQAPEPKKPTVKDSVKDFAGTLLFTLGESLKASATAPGGRGTRAGQGAALQAPNVLAQLRQQQAERQAAAQSAGQQQTFENRIRSRQAQVAEGNLAVAQTNANRPAAPPQPTAELQQYMTWAGQQPEGTDKSYAGYLTFRQNLTEKPTPEPSKPSSVAEYEFYSAQEKEAGRTPKTFEAWRNTTQAQSTGNPYLNAIRALQLEDLTKTSPSQIVSASTGRPIRNLPQSASTKVADFKSLLGQADKVKVILDELGDTNAIKGYVIREGIYVPVVQDNITPQQAEALSEVYRLINSYIYAVSGKQINEQEFARLARTAPSLVYKKGVNDTILKNFRDYAQKGLDNYLKVNGWKLAGEEAPSGGGELKLPDDIRKKLMGQ